MKEEFSIEFKGLWVNFKGIIKNILMIFMLLVFSPIVLLERKVGVVTIIRIKLKRYNNQADWSVVKYFMGVRKGEISRSSIFNNHSDKAFNVIIYYNYKSWRYFHKQRLMTNTHQNPVL